MAAGKRPVLSSETTRLQSNEAKVHTFERSQELHAADRRDGKKERGYRNSAAEILKADGFIEALVRTAISGTS